jgi:isopenicillin N synthase-like dioxygenase
MPKEEETRRRDRQSGAFFVSPDADVVIRCLDNSSKYEPITSKDYLRMRFNEKLV